MRMKMKWVALFSMLAQLCLPAAARAASTDFRLPGERGSSSLCARSAHRVGRYSLKSIVGGMAGAFETEPSTGLLLVIGLGLIGGSSLIGVKMGRAGADGEQENAGETAISPRPARNFYGERTATMHMSKS